MTEKERTAMYNKVRNIALMRLRQEFYRDYRRIYVEEALKAGIKPYMATGVRNPK